MQAFSSSRDSGIRKSKSSAASESGIASRQNQHSLVNSSKEEKLQSPPLKSPPLILLHTPTKELNPYRPKKNSQFEAL